MERKEEEGQGGEVKREGEERARKNEENRGGGSMSRMLTWAVRCMLWRREDQGRLDEQQRR